MFTNLKSLTNNNLERKLECSINANRSFNVIITQENTILNYLIKKLKLSKLTTFLLILTLSLIKNLINKANILQTSYKI